MKLKVGRGDLISLYPSGIRNSQPNMPERQVGLGEFVEMVRDEAFRDKVAAIRNTEDKARRTELKTHLPYVTVSAQFNGARKKGLESRFTNLISLDLDEGKLTPIDDELIRAQFKSVSGIGRCIVVEVDEVVGEDDFKAKFNKLKDYFEAKHGVTVDRACKDHTRARFVTLDTGAKYNGDSTVYRGETYGSKVVEVVEQLRYEDVRNYISKCLHDGLDITASLAKAKEIPIAQLTDSSTFGNPLTRDSELEKLVRSIYGLYGDQKGQNLASTHRVRISSTYADIEQDSGLFQRVKPLLPKILVDIGEQFDREGDQDAALLSALTLFSQTFLNCFFEMGNIGVQTGQLFAYIVGEAGSGKGVMGQVNKMFSKVEYDFHQERTRRAEESKLWNGMSEKDKKEHLDGGNPEPNGHFTGFFLPSDTTGAALLKNVHGTNGRGVLMAQEADTLSKFSKGENNISTLLRSAYEGETVTQSRLGDSQGGFKAPIMIDRVTLSILISSTPDQVRTLIGNVDDGLFSRFMFETLPSTTKIIDLWDTKTINHDYLADRVYDIHKASGYFQSPPDDSPFGKGKYFRHKFIQPRKDQYSKFITEMNEIFEDLTGNVSKSLSSSVTRANTRIFRIGMILSALKTLESRGLSDEEQFDTDCLAAAFEIVKTSLLKTTGVMRVFGSDIADSSNKTELDKKTLNDRRAEVCREVAADSGIDNKIQAAMAKLAEEGDRLSYRGFQTWLRRKKNNEGIVFW